MLLCSLVGSKELPEKLVVGYANWNQCDPSLIRAVEQGVNVLIWFSINLSTDSVTGNPAVTNGPDLHCVLNIIQQLQSIKLPTVHLISIGGWNSPHPNTDSNGVEDIYSAWKTWNNNLFDGIDWVALL